VRLRVQAGLDRVVRVAGGLRGQRRKAVVAQGGQVTLKGPEQTVTLKVEEPAKRQGGIKVGSVEELVDKLKNEARVI